MDLFKFYVCVSNAPIFSPAVDPMNSSELTWIINQPNATLANVVELLERYSSISKAHHYLSACLLCRFNGGPSAKSQYIIFASRYLDLAPLSDTLPNQSFKNISILLHCAAKLRIAKDSVVHHLALEAASLCGSEDTDARAVANCLWSMAKLGLTQRSTVIPVAKAAARLAGDLNDQGIANCLWAIATLDLSTDYDVIRPLAQAAARLAPSFAPQAVSNSLWAFATLGFSDSDVTRQLTKEAARLAADLNPQQSANCMWAAVKLGVSDSSLLHSLAQAAARVAPDFNPQNAANSLWAAAKLGRNIISTTT
jgi:hypothetical protein